MDVFRAARRTALSTWRREFQTLSTFFRFCMSRKWMTENPAAVVGGPRKVRGAEIEPYTENEIVRIVAACDTLKDPLDRLRARALVLLLRYTALRIGDVATLAKDRISAGRIHLYTEKQGQPVRLPVPAELQSALNLLPAPPRAATDCRYFFWNGACNSRTITRTVTRILESVFKASGVERAHCHRFRHTLASEVLAAGGSIQEAADILGNTAAVVQRHYAKWTVGREQRVADLFARVFCTNLVHTKESVASKAS